MTTKYNNYIVSNHSLGLGQDGPEHATRGIKLTFATLFANVTFKQLSYMRYGILLYIYNVFFYHIRPFRMVMLAQKPLLMINMTVCR